MKFVRFLLFPFAILYDLITSIRNFFFNSGFLKETSFQTPIIVVGNLNVGGTGKTPQIEYLVRLLKDVYKISVLSRGYKRKTNGFQLANLSSTAESVGDEPFQFYKKFADIIVSVGEDRQHAIEQLLKLDKAPEILLLDDAFQHRKVKAGLNILLTSYSVVYVFQVAIYQQVQRMVRQHIKTVK